MCVFFSSSSSISYQQLLFQADTAQGTTDSSKTARWRHGQGTQGLSARPSPPSHGGSGRLAQKLTTRLAQDKTSFRSAPNSVGRAAFRLGFITRLRSIQQLTSEVASEAAPSAPPPGSQGLPRPRGGSTEHGSTAPSILCPVPGLPLSAPSARATGGSPSEKRPLDRRHRRGAFHLYV